MNNYEPASSQNIAPCYILFYSKNEFAIFFNNRPKMVALKFDFPSQCDLKSFQI